MFKLQVKNAFVNEILGVSIDRELKFDEHVKHFCEKGGNKLNVLTRMVNILLTIIFFPNLLSRHNSIAFHFYGCFIHARQVFIYIQALL